jgi:Tfp pilus assembly protein PilN
MEPRPNTANDAASPDRVPARVEGILNLNVLPARHQPPRLSWRTLTAWIAVAVLLGLLYFSYQQFEMAGQALELQREDLTQVRQELVEAQALPVRQEHLIAEIALAEENLRALQDALDRLSIQQVSWGPVLERAVSLAPDGISLEQIQQARGQVSLVGLSRAYPLPLTYAEALRTSGLFDYVTVRSIDRIMPEEAAAGQTAEATTEGEAMTYRFILDAGIEIIAPDGAGTQEVAP